MTGSDPKSIVWSQSQRVYNVIKDSILLGKALNQFAVMKPIQSPAIGSDPYVVRGYSADGIDLGGRVKPGQLPRNCEWRLLKALHRPSGSPNPQDTMRVFVKRVNLF